MKKPHWTQTPEGKEKMGKAQKRAWKIRKGKSTSRAHKIVKKAVAKEQSNSTKIFNEMVKRLRLRRDALTTTITVLQEMVRRG